MSAARPSPAVAAMLAGDPELQREWERTAPERAVAAALVRIRRERGLSQGEVARAAAWDQAFVSRIESGRAGMPTLETIARYARICGGHARLDLTSGSGASAAVDLDAFAPNVEPAASELAPVRQRRERRLAESAVRHRADADPPGRDEEALVAKEARVTEEIAIGKDAGARTGTVRDTVRKQEVEVEREGHGSPPPRGLANEG
jgi:transcriptional regulator with XRE-family HTH domain